MYVWYVCMYVWYVCMVCMYVWYVCMYVWYVWYVCMVCMYVYMYGMYVCTYVLMRARVQYTEHIPHTTLLPLYAFTNYYDIIVVNANSYKILKQLKYVIIHSQKGTTTMFELFFEGHNVDSAIYNLLELQIQSFLISYYSSPAPPL